MLEASQRSASSPAESGSPEHQPRSALLLGSGFIVEMRYKPGEAMLRNLVERCDWGHLAVGTGSRDSEARERQGQGPTGAPSLV